MASDGRLSRQALVTEQLVEARLQIASGNATYAVRVATEAKVMAATKLVLLEKLVELVACLAKELRLDEVMKQRQAGQ